MRNLSIPELSFKSGRRVPASRLHILLPMSFVIAASASADVTAEAKGQVKKSAQHSAAAAVQPASGKLVNSCTTGWRQINGWEQNIVQSDPNLGHWAWFAKQEMNKNYIRLRPGQISLRGGVPPRSHYIKPVHLTPSARSSYHPPVPIAIREPGHHYYIKPTHVMPVVATSARVHAPYTHIALAAPRVEPRLAVPATDIRLASPRTSVRLAVPRTDIKLAVPKTSIQLASANTGIQLAAPKTSVRLSTENVQGQLRAEKVQACLSYAKPYTGQTYGDTFSDPDAYAYSPYGLSRGAAAGSTSSTGRVNAKLMFRRRLK